MFYLSRPILLPNEQAGMRVLPKRSRIIEQIPFFANSGAVDPAFNLAARTYLPKSSAVWSTNSFCKASND
ncbi:MAG: hypothetical protein ACPGWR_01455 [Ardenticatenaceae bacterium]